MLLELRIDILEKFGKSGMENITHYNSARSLVICAAIAPFHPLIINQCAKLLKLQPRDTFPLFACKRSYLLQLSSITDQLRLLYTVGWLCLRIIAAASRRIAGQRK